MIPNETFLLQRTSLGHLAKVVWVSGPTVCENSYNFSLSLKLFPNKIIV